MGREDIKRAALSSDFNDPKVVALAKKCGAFLGYDNNEIAERIELLKRTRSGLEENEEDDDLMPVEREVVAEEREHFDEYKTGNSYYSPIKNILDDDYEPKTHYDGYGNVGYKPADRSRRR